MSVRIKVLLLVLALCVTGIGAGECPCPVPSFDGTYTGEVKTGPERNCNLSMIIQEKTGAAPTASLHCIDPVSNKEIISMMLTDGVRILDELTFFFSYEDAEHGGKMSSRVRIKGWPEKCGGYYEGVVGAIDAYVKNPEAAIESFSIPYMGIAAKMLKKGDAGDQS